MRSSTGRWVSGEDFFDRELELKVLETWIRDRNHVLLTGQRRMGKTSILRELGRRLEADGGVLLFADVEGASCAEDAIAEIARAVHPVRPIARRFASGMKRWVSENVEEVSAHEFSVKIRGGLDAGSWRSHGEQLLRECGAHEQPVLLVIDELPIFLKRMFNRDRDAERVDQFLSWMRGVVQMLGEKSPVLVLSGSIGLDPLVRRLGIPDRINHLYPFRLGPWDRETSIACFERLAATYGVPCDDGVAEAVYEALGIGIPHHVQSFFARVRDFATMQETRPRNSRRCGRGLSHCSPRSLGTDRSRALRNPLEGRSRGRELYHRHGDSGRGRHEESVYLGSKTKPQSALFACFWTTRRDVSRTP